MGELRSWAVAWSTVLLLTRLSGPAAAEFQPGERLEYTFSYRGVFSGFIEIDIARASFTTASQPLSLGGREVYRASLDVTTEPFAEAELIYPFRYRYRSWLEAARQTPLLAQEYKRTGEVEEELLWFDRERGLGFRYKKNRQATDGESSPPALSAPGFDLKPRAWTLAEGAHRQPLPESGVWGYLSLLYRLRFGKLPAGGSFELPVYNGKRIKTFRIEVTRERLKQAGWDLPAFKLTLFEMRNGKRKAESVVSIWIGDEARRRPLRFHVERVFGVFEGILETDRPLTPVGDELPDTTRKSLELVF
jgi:hypothetical protein